MHSVIYSGALVFSVAVYGVLDFRVSAFGSYVFGVLGISVEIPDSTFLIQEIFFNRGLRNMYLRIVFGEILYIGDHLNRTALN